MNIDTSKLDELKAICKQKRDISNIANEYKGTLIQRLEAAKVAEREKEFVFQQSLLDVREELDRLKEMTEQIFDDSFLNQ